MGPQIGWSLGARRRRGFSGTLLIASSRFNLVTRLPFLNIVEPHWTWSILIDQQYKSCCQDDHPALVARWSCEALNSLSWASRTTDIFASRSSLRPPDGWPDRRCRSEPNRPLDGRLAMWFCWICAGTSQCSIHRLADPWTGSRTRARRRRRLRWLRWKM